MNWAGFPPLASLRAFEAAARNRSYSAAGRELNVSHAAVAQQVRSLEAHLGLRMAERAGRGISLTAEGVILAESLTRGFGEVAEALRMLCEAESTRPLHITMTPSFAVSWFLPRMPLFRAAHPEIDLMINPSAQRIDLANAGYDIAIRFGEGDWEGVESEPLLPTNFVIVASPDLLADRWTGKPEELLDLPWLQELGTVEVERWLAGQGIAMPARAHITNLPGYMLLAALRSGEGVAVTVRVFVEEDLDAGRLVILYEDIDDGRTGYHLVWRPGIQRPAVKQFLKWIRRTALESATGVNV